MRVVVSFVDAGVDYILICFFPEKTIKTTHFCDRKFCVEYLEGKIHRGKARTEIADLRKEKYNLGLNFSSNLDLRVYMYMKMLQKSRVKNIHLDIEENESRCLILSPYATMNVCVSLVFCFPVAVSQ